MNDDRIPPARQIGDKYGVGALEVSGDPATIPLPDPRRADDIRAAVRSKGRNHRKRFVTRIVVIEGERYLRVWRIE